MRRLNAAIVLCLSLALASFGQQPDAADQTPPPPPLPPAGQDLTANQLDGLVAPIALYPDPLISQILVASTYPREVTLAVQWMNQNPDLKGKELAAAAQAESWDPSIKALVMFPNVLRRLNRDKTWTTNLGNAFLAQQADVMQAVQRMRRAAKAAGKLSTTRQMKVIETDDSGETVIEIEPARPDVIFVPAYNPAWIWGPPLWYPYPRWVWGPAPVAPGVWFGFGPAIAVGAYIGPGWGGWGGWGWRPGWVNNTVVVNNVFINNTSTVNTTNVTNTNAASVAGASNPSASASTATPNPSSAAAAKDNRRAANTAGSSPAATNEAAPTQAAANARATPNGSQTSVWTHDPAHRQGVPYPNAQVAQRFHAPPPGGPQRAQLRPQGAGARGGAGRGKMPPGNRRAGPPRGGGAKR